MKVGRRTEDLFLIAQTAVRLLYCFAVICLNLRLQRTEDNTDRTSNDGLVIQGQVIFNGRRLDDR